MNSLPIYEILREALRGAQDDQSFLTDEQEEEMMSLIRILEDMEIYSVSELVQLLVNR